jgi:DNA gyrase/topoisomerase IV subunit A
MFKQIYICRNLKLYDEVQKLIAAMQNVFDSDKAVTDTVSLENIAAKVNSDYRAELETRNKWQQIREDEVLLTALRDELKRLLKSPDFNAECG